MKGAWLAGQESHPTYPATYREQGRAATESLTESLLGLEGTEGPVNITLPYSEQLLVWTSSPRPE